MAITNRERRLLVLTIAAVVVGITIVLIGPLTREWQDVRRKLNNQVLERDSMRAIVDHSAEWQRELDQLSGSFQQTPVRYEKTTDVLKKIEQIVQETGVVMIAQKPMPEVDKSVYRELPVQCTIESNIESLVKFLQALQSGAGFLTVEQLQVTLKTDNTNLMRCDVQIRALASQEKGPAA